MQLFQEVRFFLERHVRFGPIADILTSVGWAKHRTMGQLDIRLGSIRKIEFRRPRAWRRFEAALGAASRMAAGASGRTQTGRTMIDTKCRDIRFGSKTFRSAITVSDKMGRLNTPFMDLTTCSRVCLPQGDKQGSNVQTREQRTCVKRSWVQQVP